MIVGKSPLLANQALSPKNGVYESVTITWKRRIREEEECTFFTAPVDRGMNGELRQTAACR